MAVARACLSVSRQFLKFSASRNSYLLQRVGIKGPLQQFIQNSTRCLSTGHLLRAPEITDTRLSYRSSARQLEPEEDQYEIDPEELEKLQHEHREQARAQHKAKEGITFKDFDINPGLLKRLESLGYSEPFLIQTETLRHTLGGRDVIAKAVTGSGKTLSFGIPIVNKISERPRQGRSRNPRAIVISPTRELCLQIHGCIQELNPALRCVAVYGGEKKEYQERKIMKGCDVICATPGRLNDHLQRGLFGLGEVEFLCLDEADELLTPNFKDQIEDVLENVPKEKQMMLFSATIPKHIRSLIDAYMKDPEEVDITKDQNFMPMSIKHQSIECDASDVMPTVVALLKDHKPERCIIFTETKRLSQEVASDLKRCGGKAEFINSDLSQNRRENLIAAFRSGKLKILVATDVAARGLDIPEIDVIIQVKPPSNGSDYYVHRSGRTGRAGRDGLAIMVHTGTPPEKALLREIGEMVQLEHCEAPDIEYLSNVNFRTVVPFGLAGRKERKPRQRQPYGRNRFYGSRDDYGDRDFRPRQQWSDEGSDFDRFGQRDSYRSRNSYGNSYRNSHRNSHRNSSRYERNFESDGW